MSARKTPKVGSLFANRYRVESELGRGAVGVVLGVRDEKTGVSCALKLLNRPELRVDATRVIREGRALMLISHPHVLRVFDVDERPGYGPYLVLERLSGAPLSERAPLGLPMAEMVVVGYAIQICDALAHVHAAGIIHRDIKLSNMFLARGPDGKEVLKLVDFGIAKVAGPGESTATTLTKEELLGSPQFMSPEQLTSPKDVDASSDLWSLGVVLFRLLSGRFPFDGDDLGALSAAVLKAPIPTLAASGVVVSPGLQAIVDRCLQRDRTARWSSAAELGASLRALATQGAGPPPASVLEKPPRSRLPLVLALVLVLVPAAAGGAWLAIRARHGAPEGVELTIQADEDIRSVKLRGLRRLEIRGHEASMIVAPWTGALEIDAELESGAHARATATEGSHTLRVVRAH
jgi:serine/threonine protein kinase